MKVIDTDTPDVTIIDLSVFSVSCFIYRNFATKKYEELVTDKSTQFG
ncbi:hypothetical protein VIN01S_31670 [Vibrio inusitatus NBRC 102082]|uniref:Uncharacterized protein n=1 Tax=Vibrio inusitatus NBRC 102082 TaxID=1219070 RepID=A0A4Y3HYV3_9VIBR|nr:hypothetical protein VIN01S_31670 [Vibrio inusitatus NBRC 102082]